MKKIFLGLFFIFFIVSCSNDYHENKKSLVLLSKWNSNRNYRNWLLNADSSLVFRQMYGLSWDSVEYYLNKADGILITGGEDVASDLYGKSADSVRCGGFDRYRDSLEFKMINFAIENNIPLLGICRGEQIINVSQGGTLIIDIPEDVGSLDLHRKDGHQTEHYVYVKPLSYIHDIVALDSGFVISHHHQAVEKLGDGLFSGAYAQDSVIESVEFSDYAGKTFFLGVQWHPERMEYSNPFSLRVAKTFIDSVKLH